MYMPDLLTMTDGTPVTSSAQWEARRGELLNILAREQYGAFLPPSTASARVMAPPMPACAGHAMQETLEVRFDTPAGEFAFPLRFLYPADGQAHPLFLLLNFRPLIPDIYCPAEEILDNGFALAVVCYTDITADDGDWGSGLCGHYPRKHPETDPGKLVFWSYAASVAAAVPFSPSSISSIMELRTVVSIKKIDNSPSNTTGPMVIDRIFFCILMKMPPILPQIRS